MNGGGGLEGGGEKDGGGVEREKEREGREGEEDGRRVKGGKESGWRREREGGRALPPLKHLVFFLVTSANEPRNKLLVT